MVPSGVCPIQGTIGEECGVQDGADDVIKVADKRAGIGEMRILKNSGEIIELETAKPCIRICQGDGENKREHSRSWMCRERDHGWHDNTPF